jgi:hypothetical protein
MEKIQKQNLENVFSGEVFIIPNCFDRFEAVSDNPWYSKIQGQLQDFGFELKDGDYLVEVWACGSGSDNWNCHGNSNLSKFLFPEQEQIFLNLKDLFEKKVLTKDMYEEACENAEWKICKYRFPRYLPYSLLKDVKENDKITLTHKNGKVIELVANQLNLAYKRFGSFDKVIEEVKISSDSFYKKIDAEKV